MDLKGPDNTTRDDFPIESSIQKTISLLAGPKGMGHLNGFLGALPALESRLLTDTPAEVIANDLMAITNGEGLGEELKLLLYLECLRFGIIMRDAIFKGDDRLSYEGAIALSLGLLDGIYNIGVKEPEIESNVVRLRKFLVRESEEDQKMMEDLYSQLYHFAVQRLIYKLESPSLEGRYKAFSILCSITQWKLNHVHDACFFPTGRS